MVGPMGKHSAKPSCGQEELRILWDSILQIYGEAFCKAILNPDPDGGTCGEATFKAALRPDTDGGTYEQENILQSQPSVTGRRCTLQHLIQLS